MFNPTTYEEANERRDIIRGAEAELYRRLNSEVFSTRDLALCLIAHELGKLNYYLEEETYGECSTIENLNAALIRYLEY